MPALPTVCLPARQLFEIGDASAVRVLCTAGCLWLTLDHDTRDFILEPGDSFELPEPRRALLYAFEASAFALAPTEQAARQDRPFKVSAPSRHASVWAATRSATPG
jgi:hypothetical protein